MLAAIARHRLCERKRVAPNTAISRTGGLGSLQVNDNPHQFCLESIAFLSPMYSRAVLGDMGLPAAWAGADETEPRSMRRRRTLSRGIRLSSERAVSLSLGLRMTQWPER
ncbi:hypothetical protein D9M71_637050 [compost metagenome]